MTSLWHTAPLTLVLALVAPACSDDDSSDAPTSPDAGSTQREVQQPAAADGCRRHALEPDLVRTPFVGAGVHAGSVEPGQYLFATTYLRLRADQAELFQNLVGPVIADVSARPGLIAWATAQSAACGTARTITVWRDETAMLEFVVGQPHAKAMQSIYDISRGGSVAAQWMGSEATASWEAAAEHLETTDREAY